MKRHLALIIALEAVAVPVVGAAQTGNVATAPPAAVAAWIAHNAVDVGPVDRPLAPAEAAAVAHAITGARVIGFGEVGHGSREPLEHRNRLIRHLVEHGAITAIAIESGIVNTKRVGDWVLGGAGDPDELVRENLSWRFGDLTANVDLVRWLRSWNDAHPSHKVRLYGDDVSTMLVMVKGAELDGDMALGSVIDYLDRTIPEASADVRARLLAMRPMFRSDGYRAASDSDRAHLDAALAEVEALFTRQRAKMIQVSGRDAQAWAERGAWDLRRMPGLLGSWTTSPAERDKIITSIEVRDRVMADNVQWLLAREGPRGRLFVFAANGHVAAAPMIGSVMREFPRQPPVMGTLLRRRMGGSYRAIMTASARGRGAADPTIGSVDRAVVAAGRVAGFLDLRAARDGWWRQTQSLAQGDKRVDDLIPADAVDGLLYIDRLTPAPSVPKP